MRGAQANPEATTVLGPGRLLLQNGEPLSAFQKQLQQCRQLRGGKGKRCKALVSRSVLSRRSSTAVHALRSQALPSVRLASSMTHCSMQSAPQGHGFAGPAVRLS